MSATTQQLPRQKKGSASRKKHDIDSDHDPDTIDRRGETIQVPLRTPARRLSMAQQEPSTSPLTPPSVDAGSVLGEDIRSRGKGNGKRKDSGAVEGGGTGKKSKLTLDVPNPPNPQVASAKKQKGDKVNPRVPDTPVEEASEMAKGLAKDPEPVNAGPSSSRGDSLPPPPQLPSKAKSKKRKSDVVECPTPAATTDPAIAHEIPGPSSPTKKITLRLTKPTSPPSAPPAAEYTPDIHEASKPDAAQPIETERTRKGGRKRPTPQYSNSAESEAEQPKQPSQPIEEKRDLPVSTKPTTKGLKKGKRVITSPQPKVREKKADSVTADEQYVPESDTAAQAQLATKPSANLVVPKKRLDKLHTTARSSRSISPDKAVERVSPAVLTPTPAEPSKPSPPRPPRALPKVTKKPGVEPAAGPSKPRPGDPAPKPSADAAGAQKPTVTAKKPPAPVAATPSLLQGTLAALTGVGKGKTKSDTEKEVCPIMLSCLFQLTSIGRIRRRRPRPLGKADGRMSG